MSDSQAYVTPINAGLIRGYREQISGVEYVAHNPTAAEVAELRQQAVAASLATIYAQDGDTPVKRSLQDRQSLYAASRQ